jgi:hypothetical protein
MTSTLLVVHASDSAQSPARRRSRRTSEPRPEHAVCYHCASSDTMEPFARPERIFLLSRIMPRLRRRYCRACTRHFIAILR